MKFKQDMGCILVFIGIVIVIAGIFWGMSAVGINLDGLIRVRDAS